MFAIKACFGKVQPDHSVRSDDVVYVSDSDTDESDAFDLVPMCPKGKKSATKFTGQPVHWHPAYAGLTMGR